MRPKFGLKQLFLLLTVVGAATAWFLQPQISTSVTVDFAKWEKRLQQKRLQVPAGSWMPYPVTNMEYHCIRIRTPRVIVDTLAEFPKIEAFAARQSDKQVQWIYEHIEVVPVGGDKVRINVVGDASDKEEFERLASGLAETYVEFLATHIANDPALISITQPQTRWLVTWR